jgi:UTP--glucose-1-phosphate uridylyltransferase
MPAVRKAVIPAAGLGTRFLPATKAQPKEMLPVLDKPSIQYVIEEAVRAGITDILVVTGRNKQAIEDHFDRAIELEQELEAKGKHDELAQVRAITDMASVHFVRQGRALGLGHAVAMGRHHVGDEPFAVLLPDDLMHERSTVLAEMIEVQERHGGAVVALKEFPLAEIGIYGSVDPGRIEGPVVEVRRVVEKPAPEEAPSNLGMMGRYVLGPEIFDAIDRCPPGKGGEIQLTDAIGLLIGDHPVHGYVFTSGRYDIGNVPDYLKTTVELALERPDLGPGFRDWLAAFVKDQGIA